MNPDPNQLPPDDFEARLTALLLGELPGAEADSVWRAIESDDRLAAQYERLKKTIGLVREVTASPASPAAAQAAPLRLSEERRQKLLASFKTVAPVEFAKPAPRQPAVRWWIAVAACLVMVPVLAGLFLPALSKAKSQSQRFVVLNNLRQLETAKEVWAEENKAKNVTTPTLEDLKPYLGRGDGNLPSLRGEHYIIGKVGEPARAEIAANKAKDAFGKLPARPAVAGTEANVVQLTSDGDLKFADAAEEKYKVNPVGYVDIAVTTNYITGLPPAPVPTPRTAIILPLSAAPESQPTATGGGTTYTFDSSTFGQGGGNAVVSPVATPAPGGSGGEARMNGGGTLTITEPESIGILNHPEIVTESGRRSLIANDYAVTNGTLNFGAAGQPIDLGAGIPVTTAPAALASDSSITRNFDPTAITRTDFYKLGPADKTPQVVTKSGGIPLLGDMPFVGSIAGVAGATNSVDLTYSTSPALTPPQPVAFAQTPSQISVNGQTDQNRRLGFHWSSHDGSTNGAVPMPASATLSQLEPLTEPPPKVEIRARFADVTQDQNGLPVSTAPQGAIPSPEMLASIPAFRTNDARVDTLVQDGKFLFEVGKIDEAEKKLQQAYTEDPSNVAAFSYLQSIKQKRMAKASRESEKLADDGIKNVENAWRSNGQRGQRIPSPVASDGVVTQGLKQPVTTVELADGRVKKYFFGGDTEQRARIKVERDVTDVGGVNGQAMSGVYDPYFVQTETEVIRSERVLDRAIEVLKQNPDWASKNSDTLKNGQARAELRRKLDVKAEKNSSIVDIGVKDSDPKQAALIANTVAEVYSDYVQKEREEVTRSGIKNFDKRSVAKLDQETAVKQQELAQLKTPKEQDDAPLPKPALNAPIPQPEVQTATNVFSTFSLNVSDVSFRLAAASLEKGALPEAAGIRSEEFINAFDYRDLEAAAGVPVSFAWERAQDPFAHNRDLLRFSVKTAATGREPGRALNLVLLLDNSGSMERADRVRIIHEMLRVLATQLQPQDTLSVVTFARTARLRVDGVPGSQAAEVAAQISDLTPEGGTNLEDAMKLAYETALRHYLANGLNRVVLLTDGAANLGNVDPSVLKQKVEAERKQGIALDCFGIGWEGYNDDLLEVLTRNGGGRYGFINTPEEATEGFARQLAGALNVAANDVKVQVEFNPARVTAYRQVGYAHHQLKKEEFRDNTVAAAQIGAAEAGNAVYVLQVNAAGQGPLATVRCRYRVPGTQDYREQEWSVPFTGEAISLEQSSPAMRLAATASAFSEWLATSPYATEVTPDQLLRYLTGVPAIYGADTRPQKLEWMLHQAKSLSEK